MTKIEIKNNLQDFSNNNLLQNSLDLFSTLGYTTKRQVAIASVEDFRRRFLTDTFNEEKVMVYKLYDLTYSEVKTIDPEFSMSEQAYNDYQI